MTVLKDIIYKKTFTYGGEPLDLLMDGYAREKNAAPKPVVMLIHGGGFVGGAKDQDLYVEMAGMFAEAGFAVFSANYRLVEWDKPGAPNNAEAVRDDAASDIIAAIRHIRANPNRYDSDASRVVVCGDSAGAAIAVGAAYKYGRAEGIAGCVALWGGMPLSVGGLWNGNVFAHSLPADGPPCLLIHGTADETAEYGVSVRFSTQLSETGVKNRLLLLPDAPHYTERQEDKSVYLPEMLAFALACAE